MSRGIEGRPIFADDEDRKIFLSLLSAGVRKYRFKCYAWVLMSNHYHFLLRTSEQSLSSMMRWLNSSYSRSFNFRHKRRGYLFQDRYKSIVTQDQGYIEELVRYIHLNPVRSGTCRSMKELAHYAWCGHAAILGIMENNFQNTAEVLHRFAAHDGNAKLKYRSFMEEGLKTGESADLLETIRKSNDGKENLRHTGTWVIGDSDFVRKVIARDAENRSRIVRHLKENVRMEDVMQKISQLLKISTDQILRRSRGGLGAEGRKLFVHTCRNVYNFGVSETGRYLGISGPATSVCLREGEKLIAARDDLKTEIESW